MLVAALFATFFGLIILEVPIAIALVLSALLIGFLVDIPPIVVVQNMFTGIDSYVLLAIPLFMLSGDIMEKGSITDRLVAFSRSMVGHIRGSLGQVTIFANLIMAGISGSGASDAAALGSVLIPAMKKEGYSGEMAVAINASAATMGPIVPPSILMILFGAYGGVSVAALFLGGVIPGSIICVTLMIVLYRWARKTNFPVSSKAPLRERISRTKESIWALLVPFIIVFGIVGGIFTPTESAMVAAVYSILVAAFIYRSFSLQNMMDALKKSAISVAHPMFAVAGAGAFGFIMAYLQVPELVLQLSSGITGKPLPTLFFITILFVVLGTFMDSTPALIIFMPIVMKLGQAAALNMVHVGVLVTVVLCFGFLTPPYGITLLISSGIGGVPVMAVIKKILPFYCVMIGIILAIIFFPELVLFLPRIFVPSAF
jgi:tripartite ATP-independent transporter DctM subunit